MRKDFPGGIMSFVYKTAVTIMVKWGALVLGLLLWSGLTTLCSAAQTESAEQFREEMLIRPLGDGNLLTHLQFRTSLRWNATASSSLAQTVQKFGVEQFRLVFTRGRWQSDAWGAAIMDAPSGAQLAASFLDAQEAESGWHGLIHSLAGMFCASLGSLNDQSRLDPYYSYLDMTAQNERIAMDAQRQVELQWQEELIGNLTDHFGDHRPVDAEWARLAAMGKSTKKFYANRERVLRQSSPAAPASRLFYGELPEETVCTENLTPWSKLLPCRAESGMAKLLHSTRLLSGQYYSMGAHFQYRVPDHCSLADLTSCDDVTLELIQTLTVVFRTETLKEYSIASLFGEEEMRACVLSQGQSHVHVQMPKRNDEILTISPEPTRIEGDIRTFDLSPSDPLSLQFSISNRRQNRKNLRLGTVESPLKVSRAALGNGEANGGVITTITNPTDRALSLSYLEYMPWYLPVYYHSLRVFFNTQVMALPEVAERWRFRPADDHSIPSVIEIDFTIPPHTTASFTYRHDQSFLQWTEHPPDAHRGSDVPSACVTINYPSKPDSLRWTGLDWDMPNTEGAAQPYYHRVYSEGLLILLPTPDFSMPYNVITLTCTMFAIIFTSTINVLTRRFKYLREGGEYSSGRISLFLFRKVRDFLTRS